jgi:pimeloyl-ACP methyl ester carboxylesterase
LFIAGCRDSVVTGRIGAMQVNELGKLLQKSIVDGAGHWVLRKRPAEVNAALIAFLKG